MKKCNGIFKTKERCYRNVINNQIYCDKHKYFENFSDEQINDIINDKAKTCNRCNKWNFDNDKPQCSSCFDKNKEYAKQRHMKKIRCKWIDRYNEPCRVKPLENNEYCKFHQYVNNYTEEQKLASTLCKGCNLVKYLVDGCTVCRERAKENREKHKSVKIICKGFVGNNSCVFEAQENGYCKKHQVQMWINEIEMDKTKKVCSGWNRGCKNILDINYEFKKCDDCRKIERENDYNLRFKKKADAQNIIIIDNNSIIKSKLVGKFDDDSESQENNSIIKSNLSFNDNLVTKNSLSSNDIKIRSNDDSELFENNLLSDDIKIQSEDNQIDNKGIKMKKCIKCNNYYTLDKFLTLRGNPSDKCNVICLPLEREKDRKRDRAGRDYKTYEKKPERIAKKKEWKENNYEKIAGYWINARSRQIEKLGVEEYLKKNAEQASKYRKEHPEKQDEANRKQNININYRYNNYKRNAENKGREYNLTYEESKQYFLGDCYYCGNPACEQILLNGIDRKKNDGHYTLDNCVTACDMCNFMKGDSLDDNEFIKVCEHILTYLDIIKGNLYPECFDDYIPGNYDDYKKNANKKNIDFLLSELQFYDIIYDNCYLCGKENSDSHINGIDRVHNDIGYCWYNCKSCCATCNYLKNSYNIVSLLNKITKIYLNFNKNADIKSINYNYIIEPKIINITDKIKEEIIEENRIRKQQNRNNNRVIKKQNSNENSIKIKKMTKEEIREKNRIRKQQNRENLRLRYGDEEYKRIHAQNIANNRALKKAAEKNFLIIEDD